VDWEGARKELQPRLEKAASMARRGSHEQLLGRLGHTHVAIIPAALYQDIQNDPAKEKNAKTSQPGVPGFDVRVVNDEALVVRVTADSPRPSRRPARLADSQDQREALAPCWPGFARK